MHWVVFVDRSYYPYVEDEYDTEAEAMVAAEGIAKEEANEDPEIEGYEAKIYVAQIVKVFNIKTAY